MNSTTLKRMTKDETEAVETKISCKPTQNFFKCSHLQFCSFLCPQNCSALFVGHACIFIISPHQFLFHLCASVSWDKNHAIQSPDSWG